MGFDGSGGYNRVYNWVSDKNAGTKIVASRMDAEMDDMASGFSMCLTKDGQQDPTQNLPMNSKKHTGVAAASARTEYVDLGSYVDGAFVWAGTASGTSAIALTLNPTITTYTTGMRVGFIAAGDNASAVTINVDGVSAAAGVKGKNDALVNQDIVSGGAYWITYKGADGWQFENPLEENPTFVTLTTTGDGTFGADISVSGNIAVVGTVDGRDVATDGTKLDGVEAGSRAPVVTTKGDLEGHDGTSAVRFPVGSDGQIIIASSSATAGLSWGDLRPQIFTSNGTYNVPNGITEVLVEAVGGGGGGGGAGGISEGGGGSGSGGFVLAKCTVTSGGSETVTIGTGGNGASGGVESTAGTTGTASTFGSLVTAGGGGAAVAVPFSPGGGGAGGTASTTETGIIVSQGNAGSSGSGSNGGRGGNHPSMGGNGVGSAANAASLGGGGGGGNAPGGTGGDGADGYIIVTPLVP